MSALENNNDHPYEMSPRPSRRVIEKIAGVLAADAEEGKRLAGHFLKPGSGEGEAAPSLVPASGPAAQLVQEKLAAYKNQGDVELTVDQMDALIDDIEEYANMRLNRTVRQKEEREKQGAA